MSFSFCKRYYLSIVTIFIVSFSSLSFAKKLSLVEFSQSLQWQKLLHYKENSNNQSYITSKQYFLSSTIKKTPLDELKATINAFYTPIQDNTLISEHAQCRFPARLILIKKHVKLTDVNSFPTINCEKYKHWLKEVDVSSISIVFASGYMSNPASMYGHLFLKLNRSQAQNDNYTKSDLLNASLNYGAIVPNDDNPITYILKGIFGGYNAGYSDQQFYRHQHNYGNIELRDLWDYKLSLNAEDVELIVAHIWELLGIQFDYYFIDENCAFHIAKLLEIVLAQPLISNDSLWVLPTAVAKGLEQASHHEEPLLKRVKYIPSSESILHNYYQQLTKEQQEISQDLINKDFNFSNEHYQQLSVLDKQVIVESLFQYLSVIKQKQPDNMFVDANKKKLMKERFKMPIGKVLTTKFIVKKPPPHQGMKPSKYSLGLATLNQRTQYLTAGFRMNFFDDLSSSVARQSFANLEMIDVALIAVNDKVRITKVDLIDIKSLYLPTVPWTNTSESIWSVRAGYEQLNNDCFDCGIFFAEGEIGKSKLVNKNHLIYAMLGGKLFFGADDDIDISAKLGMISTLNDKVKIKFEMQKTSDVNFSKASKNLWYSEVNYQIAQNWELRLSVKKQDFTFTEFKVNYFWGF